MKRICKRGLIAGLFLLGPLTASAAPDFKAYRALVDANKKAEAQAWLQNQLSTTQDKDTQSLLYFASGQLAIQSADATPDKAVAAYKKSLELGSSVEDHIHFALGSLYLKANELTQARNEFQKAFDIGLSSELTIQARLKLVQLAIQEKRWSEAQKHLVYLEKRGRSRDFYPEVIFDLLKVEMNGKRKFRACKWARKLYSRYPAYSGIAHWDLDLHKATVDGKPLACVATPEDQRVRLKSLQFSGEFQEAKREIEILRGRTGGSGRLNVDMILANFYVEDGYIDEALKILAPYAGQQSSNFKYLSLVGKAAVRAGDFQVAVSSYDKAYQASPNSRNGKNALYLAANLSFMAQDYDGAMRRYENVIKRFGRAGFARDAGWFIAFTRYMRGDYEGALQDFSKLKSGPAPRRRGRRHRVAAAPAVTSERLKYWTSMCLMRLGRTTEAKAAFQTLAQDRGYGYYALAARARVKSLESSSNGKNLAGAAPTPTESPSIKKSIAAAVEGVLSPATAVDTGSVPEVAINQPDAGANEVVSDEDETSVTEDPTEDQETAETAEGADEDENEPSLERGLIPSVLSAHFKDPRLLKRFQRASDLYSVGAGEWVRFELIEIERRTFNRDYLKRLIQEYELSQNYYRSSIIAETNFRNPRLAGGLQQGRGLWESAYPQAFKSSVSKYAPSFGVPSEFVWSIMRAESQYRPEAKSSVGAMGLMQVMPFTALEVARRVGLKEFQPPQLLQSDTNIQVGSRYLAKLYSQFQGRVALAAAAYNAGPHRVEAWVKYMGGLDTDEFIEHIPYAQTRNYVKKVTHNFVMYSSLYVKSNPSLQVPQWLAQPLGVSLDRPVSPREVWE